MLLLISVPLLLYFINHQINDSSDYNMVINEYALCGACKEITGEKPNFKRISYSSSGYSPRIYVYKITVKGDKNQATIKAELESFKNRLNITSWKFSTRDTVICR